LVPVEVR